MLISGGLEVVGALFWGEGAEEFADVSPERVDGSGRFLTQQGLELGERHLDGVHVRFVTVDPKLHRPAEAVPLVGDASKAKAILGWEPKLRFDAIMEEMVAADLARPS